MPPRRTPAPALLLLLLLGAGPRSGCLASPCPLRPARAGAMQRAAPPERGVCSQPLRPSPAVTASPAGEAAPALLGSLHQLPGEDAMARRGCGAATARCPVRAQGPDPSFSLRGWGDGSGSGSRGRGTLADLASVSLCLSWFSGRASPGLSGAPLQGLVAGPGSHTSGMTMNHQVARPLPWPSHLRRAGSWCLPWQQRRASSSSDPGGMSVSRVTPTLCPAGPEDEPEETARECRLHAQVVGHFLPFQSPLRGL